MKLEFLRVCKRNLLDIDSCKYSFAIMLLSGGISLLFRENSNGDNIFLFEIFFPIFIVSSVVFFACGILGTISMNNLLKNGKVIWATVDVDMMHYDGSMLSVYCYEEKGGQKIYYKATQGFDRRLEFPVKQFLRDVGIIPVVIDPEDGRRYVVLIKDIVYMCDSKKRDSLQTDVIRTIEWM